MKKILYGVCGIGNGHTYRQAPILDCLAQSHKIMIFAYDNSLKFFAARFAHHPNVKIAEVAVPYFVGCNAGIDFAATAIKAAASEVDYTTINSQALSKAQRYLGAADLIISDYEPTSAQYAYALGAPLVTIDQQSKYLSGDFPPMLNGRTSADEAMRLRMFFPAAAARIACSFFRVPQLPNRENVQIFPPVLRAQLEGIKKTAKRNPRELLVYLSAQDGLGQSPSELLAVLATQSSFIFHVFLPAAARLSAPLPKNVAVHQHGETKFEACLKRCSGIVATAGHSLLSEAMYLGVPVLALPLPLYEQYMNATIISESKFGLTAHQLTPQTLQAFIRQLPFFACNIERDTKILLRGDGRQAITDFLAQHFL